MYKQPKSATITSKNASILMFFYLLATAINAKIQALASESPQIDTVKPIIN